MVDTYTPENLAGCIDENSLKVVRVQLDLVSFLHPSVSLHFDGDLKSTAKCVCLLVLPLMSYGIKSCEDIMSFMTVDDVSKLKLPIHGWWQDVGSEQPQTGTEIKNENLAKALQQQKCVFTQKETDDFRLLDVSVESYIKVNRTYFKPAVPEGLSAILTKVLQDSKQRREEV
jgi:hypothetical protein